MMSGDQVEQKLADHLVRYEFRNRDIDARIVGDAQIGLAAAEYVMRLARRLGQDDLSDDLGVEINEYLKLIDDQRDEISRDFDATGLGPIDRWFDADAEAPDA